MPREMHIQSLDGTRWTSTSSAATLKAPHGGMAGLSDCGCGRCARCGKAGGLNGLGGCGCGANLRHMTRRFALQGLELVGTTTVDTLKPNERTLISVTQFVFGQPPLNLQNIVDQTTAQLMSLGYTDIKVTSSKVYPLAWSWAWEAGPKIWTAYVSNADAGPYTQELNIAGSSFTVVQDAAPTAADTKAFPTQGVVLTVDALPPTEVVTPEALGTLREALRKVVLTGTGVHMYIRARGTPKKGLGWLWGLAALGGLAYARSKA